MAKIKAYKFVNPGSVSSSAAPVKALRVSTLALNRMGATITSVANTVGDLEHIAAASQKLEKEQAILERKQARREADAAAEEQQELDKLEKGTAAKRAGKKKPSSAWQKMLKGPLGWIANFLGPIAGLFTKLYAIGVIKGVLEYLQDPAKVKELTVFFEKTEFVFTKLYNFASGLVNNVLDGFAALSDPNGDFGGKIKGLGQMLTGIIGLKYLMNPFSLITDILGILDILDQDRDRDPKIKPKSKKLFKEIAEEFGELALKRYKFWLKKNPQLAKLFLGALRDGKSVKAAEAVVQRALKKLPPPKKNWWQKLGDSFNQKKTKWTTGATDIIKDVLGKGTKLKDNILEGAGKKWKEIITPKNTKGQSGLLDWLGKGKDWLWEGTKSNVQKGWKAANRVRATAWKSIKENWDKIWDDAVSGFNRMNAWAQEHIIKNITKVVEPWLSPILKKVKGIGAGLVRQLTRVPGIRPVLEFLQTKGVKGFGDFGKLAGEIGPKMLVGIGGLVNLMFAYERFREKDWVGGTLEGVSGVLDLSSILTGGTGSVASSVLDLYLFARDLMPLFNENWDLKKVEDGLINKVGGGLSWATGGLKTLANKLKEANPLKMLKEGVKEQDDNQSPSRSGNVNLKKDNQTAGSQDNRPWWKKIFGGADGGQVRGYFFGGIVKGISKAVSGVVKGVTKAVSSVGSAVGSIVSNPLVQTVASFIPGVGPIVQGIGAVTSLMSGDPLGAIMMGANKFFPGTMGKINDFMDSKWGKLGTSLLTGDFRGAALQGLDMIPGDLGGFKGHLSSFINDPNPMNLLGNLAGEMGLGGVFKAVTGIMQGDYSEAIQELGSELGIDPKVLGVAKNVSQNWSKEGGLSQEYIINQAMDFIPVPIIVEKIQALPTPVPINIDEEVVTGALSSIASRL